MISSLKSFFSSNITAEALMSQYVKSGKNHLLQRLVELHADDLYHYLLTQTHSELAKDISQKTWLKVIDKRQHYQNTGSFKAWLFTVARNSLLDEFRKNNRFEPFQEDQMQQVEISITSDSQLADKFELILAQLPFVQKEAFVLQQEGFSIEQIANITGSKVETIKTRLRYARNQFKQHLGE